MSLTPLLKFPVAIVSQDECEECRGTGYKMVSRPDGAAGQIATRCAHRIAAIAGKWQPVTTWQDGLSIRIALPREPRALHAEQLAINWTAQELERQKAEIEEWMRAHTPELEEVLV